VSAGAFPLPVLGAVLGAALLHASWNALLKRRGGGGDGDADPLVSMLLVVAGAGACAAVLLPFLDAPAPASWPFIAASTALQTAYYLLLAATYRAGDVSHAYPLMRGSAPLLVALANGPLTGERLGGAQWLATLLICGGVLAMWLDGRGRAREHGRTSGLALATACVIAAYTLVDGAGVRRSSAPAAYTLWIFLGTGLAVWLLAARRRLPALLAQARARPLLAPLGGMASLASYGIALWAMTRAPVAAVAALRETSILFATAIAAFVLRERVGRMRVAAACLIACGAVAMRLA
jgi:drug/metabolite transporter (DMT)-like permease